MHNANFQKKMQCKLPEKRNAMQASRRKCNANFQKKKQRKLPEEKAT